MDYITLISNVKNKYKLDTSSVITFGGSYGGMLAAWMRMKHPNYV